MPKTKKQIIIQYCEQHGIKAAGPPEIRMIHEAVRRAVGSERKTSFSYIAEVLRRSGVELQSQARDLAVLTPEPYASRLRGVLQFRDLASAEACLRRLDEEHKTFVQASDRTGISAVKSLLLKGKLRARRLAADSRVDPVKRQEKQEIALWFTIWLQTPDLFFSWLAIRKRSEEFQRIFGKPDCGSPAQP
jgi:hypothetical protein